MDELIYVKNYEEPPRNVGEILRYAGCPYPGTAEWQLLRSCLAETEGKMSCRVCYREVDMTVSGNTVDLGFAAIPSAGLARHLAGHTRGILFAATVGLEIDRLIARYSEPSPARALFFQAIGTERIEALCDRFCADMKAATSRFSPGYGDWPLSFQEDIFRALDCPRKIGVSLNESLLMSPSKSVTAIFAVKTKQR